MTAVLANHFAVRKQKMKFFFQLGPKKESGKRNQSSHTIEIKQILSRI